MSQDRGMDLASSGVCSADMARELLQQKNSWKSSLGVLYVFHACAQQQQILQEAPFLSTGSVYAASAEQQAGACSLCDWLRPKGVSSCILCMHCAHAQSIQAAESVSLSLPLCPKKLYCHCSQYVLQHTRPQASHGWQLVSQHKVMPALHDRYDQQMGSGQSSSEVLRRRFTCQPAQIFLAREVCPRAPMLREMSQNLAPASHLRMANAQVSWST